MEIAKVKPACKCDKFFFGGHSDGICRFLQLENTRSSLFGYLLKKLFYNQNMLLAGYQFFNLRHCLDDHADANLPFVSLLYDSMSCIQNYFSLFCSFPYMPTRCTPLTHTLRTNRDIKDEYICIVHHCLRPHHHHMRQHQKQPDQQQTNKQSGGGGGAA